MNHRPVAIGLFLCDQVIIEESTRNVSLVNCFTHRAFAQFPSEPFPFVVFAILTDGLGRMAVEVVIQRLEDLDDVFRRSVPVQFTNPLQEVRCMLRLRDLSFPQAGEYQVSLLVEGEMLAHRKLRLVQEDAS